MRLLDVHTKKLHTFYNGHIPRYAILSHMWWSDEEEVTFAQIKDPESCNSIRGFSKIDFLCRQAAADGYKWAWIDTCCIDKTSSAELSEAINSMFEWYEKSAVCYALLVDIDRERDDFLKSRWWSRAWTLQELLAPQHLIFFDKHYIPIGSKDDWAADIERDIHIDEKALRHPLNSAKAKFSVAQRMSWASQRVATRTEDVAYSLLGIFEVNMPLLYGEGNRAFSRLQREILQKEHDQTLFAWSFRPGFERSIVSQKPVRTNGGSLLALSPKSFEQCGKIVMLNRHGLNSEIREFDDAHHLDMYIIPCPVNNRYGHYFVGILPCRHTDYPEHFIGILLQRFGGLNLTRVALGTFLLHRGEARQAECVLVHIRRQVYYDSMSNSSLLKLGDERSFCSIEIANNTSFSLEGYSPHNWKYTEPQRVLFVELVGSPRQCLILGFYNYATKYLLVLILKWYIDSVETFVGMKYMLTPQETIGPVLNSLQGTNTPLSPDKAVGFGIVAKVKSNKIFNQISRTVYLEEDRGRRSS